jgi:U3 small nucleolar RNA-associated protein 18
MAKKMSKKAEAKPRKEYLSPLTAEADADKKDKKTEKTKSRQTQNSQKRARKDEQEDLEEQRLTALLFGSGAPNRHEESVDNAITKSQVSDDDDEEDKELGFVIDKTGEDVELDDEEMQAKSDDENDDSDESLNEGEKDEDDAPAWVDQDDNELSVDIVGTSNRLKKLRKSRDEVAAKALDGEEFERRLRKRYEETTQATARTDWARLEPAKKRPAIRDEDDEDDEAALLASTSAPLLATSQHRLPPNILNIMRCPDANQADPNKAAVQAVHFHPGSNPDQPLLLTAGLDKTLRFFSVGAEKSEKIHGIHCKSSRKCLV